MRKILNLILAALIVLSLVACGSETSNEIRTDSGTETGQSTENMDEKFVQFAEPVPDEEFPFTVCGQTVLLCNAALAAALSALPGQMQEVILILAGHEAQRGGISSLSCDGCERKWRYDK